MKVAVCVSGAFKCNSEGGLVRYNTILKNKFPGSDFYYSTWESYQKRFESIFPGEKCTYFKEPAIHYHPYLDIEEKNYISKYYLETIKWIKQNPERIMWSSHHTKQILIHFMLADKVKDKYDVIVRTRFDAFIHKNAQFEAYIEDTHRNKRANGFAATKQNLFDVLKEFDKGKCPKMNFWLADQLIIHPSEFINLQLVNDLTNEKKLHSAEFGWCQVLSAPYSFNHRSHDGWVNHDRNVIPKFLKEE